MGVKLQAKTERKYIPVTDMKDGDIAEIVCWEVPMYTGRIVQRYDKHLITIGRAEGSSWPHYFAHVHEPGSGNQVRLLNEGETLEVTKGE